MSNWFWQRSFIMATGVVLILGIMLVGCGSSESEIENPSETINESSNPIAIIHTSMGDITLELFAEEVPVTVQNFVKLAKDGFYDGLIFHRISDDFMIQAGVMTPDGTMKTSPYGTIDLEINPNVRHADGAISMARSNDPNSATSQFFICDGAQPFLNDKYAAFGVVVEGIDVVRAIAAQPHDNSNPAGGGRPLTDIVINSIEIQEGN